MPTSAKTYACYTSHKGATVLAEVHTIWLRRTRNVYSFLKQKHSMLGSGLPLRRDLEYYITLKL